MIYETQILKKVNTQLNLYQNQLIKHFILVKYLSSELKKALHKFVDEEYERKISEIDKGLKRYKAILLNIDKSERFEVVIWVEGMEMEFQQRKDLNLLENCGLVKGQNRYEEHNAYRRYMLSDKGRQLTKKLKKKE